MSIERIAAQQLQVDARGFAHLGGAARLDPALGGDADAAHAPARGSGYARERVRRFRTLLCETQMAT